MGILNKFFGTYSEREISKIRHYVSEINDLEESMKKLSDQELKNKTNEFKDRLSKGETLDDILAEAFAVAREGSVRVFGKRPFDVQLIGGIILHQGRIAEMKTGEGKTLTATLALYLNSLTNQGAHLVTVNDYLAKSQGEEMGKLYNFLGLSVGIITHDLDNSERRNAYNADITYGTNNEFGFDYLRDNMAIRKEDMVQRDLHYAIVDEIDSILIDEARTPLIISGQADKANDLYKLADRFVKGLKRKVIAKGDDKQAETTEDEEFDYIVEEKTHSASLTATGIAKAEKVFNVTNISDIENTTLLHHVNQALKANGVMKRDKDYIVKDDEVLIIDEHTGRIMYGRRYSDGLHQAIEAKENVSIANESKTLATITFQNYFRLFDKLCGMTGTAMTEENEFRQIYGLDVVEVPTNMPMIRIDREDLVYKTERGKLRAVVEDIKASHEKGQPVLVGTITIEKSEVLSEILKREGIKHEVLNAKFHAKEAEIIAQAGRYGAVTIATNMAGRGTDIMLGGNAEALAKQELRKRGILEEKINLATSFNDTGDEEILELRREFKTLFDKFEENVKEEKEKVISAGGLKIIGTERHESRRIDNQLRGRSGRQGDIGESRFYVSFEDDLMRLFGSERIQALADAMNMSEDMPIEMKMLTKTIENAQKNVEERNFGIRKHVLQYDDVMNKQREIIYSQRRRVLDGQDVKSNIEKMIDEVISSSIATYLVDEHEKAADTSAFESYIESMLGIKYVVGDKVDTETVHEELIALADKRYQEKEKEFGEEAFRECERVVMLRTVDAKWMDHIDAMDQLKQGVGLRGYGQKDPVIEFKYESYDMFNNMTSSIGEEVVRVMMHVIPREKMERVNLIRNAVATLQGANNVTTEKNAPKVNKTEKVGRNDLCPCGSGKKYKKCCGANKEN